MPFQPSPYRDEIIEALKNGESIDEVTKRFPVSKKTVQRYAQALKEGKLEEPPKGPAQPKAGGNLATVLQPSRGAIVFTLGEHQISLNPQHLYDAYLYYEDMTLRESVDEEFSLVIKDCVKVAWERLNHRRDEGRRASITVKEG
ncbi:unnamed protein product [marine sediment metagenome]|uniref:Uncharacterized protein n=1 Tax=marine sediment metagenome TaxID=412755 RepID=X1LZQ8_9ZZZZ